MNTLARLATLALAALLPACATTHSGDSTPLTISPTPWQAMIADAATADVVVIGEQHGHPTGLPMMARLWTDLIPKAQAAGHTPALALEFIERDHQLALDDYLAGLIDEETFRTRTARTDTNYPAAHRDMVEAARAANLPVIAANAPRRYVRMARTEGYDRLRAMTPAQRATFVIPDPLTTGQYRDRFFDLFRQMMAGGQGASGKEAAADQAGPDESALNTQIEAFYRSQQVWDATMADSVARAVRAGHRPVVLVIGQFHSDYTGGTIDMIDRALQGERIVTISMVDANEPAVSDIDRADYLLMVGPRPE